MNRRDLFVVVADLDAENTLKTLLIQRQEALRIRLTFNLDGDLLRYSGRDSGCYKNAVDLLRPPQRTHHRALICFDRHGCGAETRTREDIEEEVESLLSKSGWNRDDIAAIVIDPELEAWVWADSPEVAHAMGWSGDLKGLRSYLIANGLWPDGETKPPDPKKAMERALKAKRRRGGTARLFAELAQKVGLRSCKDPAFNKLSTTLRHWFPAGSQRRAR